MGVLEQIDQKELLALTGKNVEWLKPHSEGKYISVSLDVSDEFIHYVIDNDVNVSVVYSFCEQEDTQLWIGLPNLYYAGGTLTDKLISGELNKKNVDSYGLKLALFSQWDGKQDKAYSESLPYHFTSYNLISEPMSVCFSIQAVGMVNGTKSEVVKIPKTEFVFK
ncbi:hypothetical protein [Enterovibrio norvegicus]|uniref:hypothetical protein n=1 Tax=Enterovibrio norvegicus TaxID=188144 RepID=UPI000C866E58|nr:hypothetical protein [Enterovibrio norvegicus]PML81846.1 hypothetical protein BCT69_00445 [Enterovibrio norvegicus]